MQFQKKTKKHYLEAIKKWQQKEYKCPICDEIMKNSSRYVHKKNIFKQLVFF